MSLTRHPLFVPYTAFASVCFFWGTTYLAIRMSLETFPPLLLVGTRFTISGTILLIAARLMKMELPSRRDVGYSALYGLLALGVGNGCLTYSELWIPSSLAALLVTTSPFWMVGLEAMMPDGEKLRPPIVAGLLMGLAGTGVLVGPNAWSVGLSGSVVKGFLILQVGGIAWVYASIAQRRRVAHMPALVTGAIQQLTAGIALLLPAVAMGQRPESWSGRGVGAMLYLVVFGSIVGYTSYVHALKTLPVAIVTLHTYVNPVVAAALGWMVYREPFGGREIVAMAIIFLGVAVVKRYGSGPPGGASPLRPPIPSPAPSPPSPRPGSATE